jgi:uncharacterized NAD(P)/FAD-binding protein YdhS/quercetin dioxygenase-like cupin family protein
MDGPLLSRINAAESDLTDLVPFLQGDLDWDSFATRASFSPDRYVRQLLHRQENFELRLLCWLPGQSSALHSHGRSHCAFRVIAGRASELKLHQGHQELSAGEVSQTLPGEIHQIANLGDQPLITLHLYAPPLPADVPVVQAGRSVVIIGGGWTGLSLATRLLEQGGPDLRLTLIERGPELGRGVAFGTFDPEHILNVPASDMSMDPRNPKDFLDYLEEHGQGVPPERFVSRRVYGDYVRARFVQQVEQRSGRVRILHGEAIDVLPEGSGWKVQLGDGHSLQAEHVVLATGVGPVRLPRALEPLRGHPGLIEDVWAPGAVQSIPGDHRVLVVGTGLTALDLIASLRRQGHRGSVIARSRHGWWPKSHLRESWKGPKLVLDVDHAPKTADGLAAWVRQQVAERPEVPWQVVFGAIRPQVNRLWATLDSVERDRFLSLYRPEWEVHRHRAPPQSLELLRAWEAEGGLRTEAGELVGSRATPSGLVVWGADGVEREVDHILVATGNESDVDRQGGLWAALRRRGLVQRDAQGLGIWTEEGGAVRSAAGPVVPGLWAVGAMQRPRLFENTAVPDLACRVAELVEVLVPWLQRV